jgi:hypothetical protein
MRLRDRNGKRCGPVAPAGPRTAEKPDAAMCAAEAYRCNFRSILILTHRVAPSAGRLRDA